MLTKRLVALLLSFSFLSMILSVPAMALENELNKNERRQQIFESQIKQTSNDAITIHKIRDIHDFADNNYTVIECVPTGYYIYHNASGNFIEYSPESPSPYKDVSGPLYYGGPMEYFYKQGNQYIHTLEAITFDQSVKDELSKICEQNATQIPVNQAVLNFIEEPILSRSKSDNAEIAREIIAEQNSARGTTAWVDGASYLRDIQYMPSNTEGTCGYVACCLILWYWQRMGYNMIDSGLSAVQGLPNNRLHDQLRAYGSCGTAVGAVEILTKYCKDRNIPAQIGWNLAGIGMESEIRAGRPVILFGNLKYPYNNNYVNHAVVAYGWLSNGGVVANYGWPGYNYVIVQGIYGTNTHFRPM